MADKQNKNPAAVALGRLGGLKGGPARTASMTPAQRKAAARKATQDARPTAFGIFKPIGMQAKHFCKVWTCQLQASKHNLALEHG